NAAAKVGVSACPACLNRLSRPGSRARCPPSGPGWTQACRRAFPPVPTGRAAFRAGGPPSWGWAWPKATAPAAPGEQRAPGAAAKRRGHVRPGLLDRSQLPGEPSPPSPIGASLDTAVPRDVPAVADGLARVQDEGSALVALALAEVDAPAGTWGDLCAGPGGKAAVLGAAAAQEGQTLEAFDSSEHRVELVRDSTRALNNVTTAVRDGRAARGPYAKVLVDVPCSGLGALRRRPEARYRRQPSDITALTGLQRELLTAALDACAPGGVVAYSTCSPHYAET